MTLTIGLLDRYEQDKNISDSLNLDRYLTVHLGTGGTQATGHGEFCELTHCMELLSPCKP